jgi:hypothetical protein
MICDNCDGKGYTISHVTGREQECNVCEETGMLNPCSSYSTSGLVVIFRDQRCVHCGVRGSNHPIMAEV